MNKRVEHWIRTFAFFEPMIDEYGEKHSEHMDKVREYKNVVVEIFNHDKQGLIKESAADTIMRKVEEARSDPKYRQAHPDVFGGPVDLACDDPLYDGEHVF